MEQIFSDRRKKLMLLFFMGIGFLHSAKAQVIPLPFSKYNIQRKGLENAREAITVRKQATVAFLGGSITHNSGWRDMVCAYLKQEYPKTKFHFIAAGIPSLGSLPHAFRLQRDVLDSGKVDLLFLEAAVNDQVNHTDSVSQVRALEGIIRHAKKSNPLMDVVMMSFADQDKTQLYGTGKVPVSVANHELIAAHYGLPSVNLAKAVSDKLANKEFDWEKDFKDVHPSPFGQQLYFDAIKDLLDSVLIAKKGGIVKTGFKRLPAMLDKASFTNGKYLDVDYAVEDSKWALNKDWNPEDKLPVRPGFVNVPVLLSTEEGATLSLKFKGNAVGIAIVSGADAGILKYSIDNGPEKQIDTFTEWSRSLYLPWYLVLGSGLTNTSHVLKLSISAEKNKNSSGTACRIVHFLINN